MTNEEFIEKYYLSLKDRFELYLSNNNITPLEITFYNLYENFENYELVVDVTKDDNKKRKYSIFFKIVDNQYELINIKAMNQWC